MKSFIQYLQEAEIYSSEQMGARGRSPEAAAKRESFLKKIEGSNDPSLVRVAADIRDTSMPSPGSEKVEAARAANRAAKERYKGVYGTDFPEEGMADVSDMRKAIAFVNNVDMSPDASDSPMDADTTGSALEVKADAAVRSMGTDPRAAAIRQQPILRGSKPFPTPSEMASKFFTQGRKTK
jgi:hypothetical protein